MLLATLMKQKRFCGPYCRGGYDADKEHGIVRPSWVLPTGKVPEGAVSSPCLSIPGYSYVSHEIGTAYCRECCYCGMPLKRRSK